MDTTRLRIFLQAGLAAGGPVGAFIIHKYNLGLDEYSLYVQLALYMITPASLAWIWFDSKVDKLIDAIAKNHTDKLIRTVSQNPSVAGVVVKNEANGVVGAIADDTKETKVMRESDAKEIVKP